MDTLDRNIAIAQCILPNQFGELLLGKRTFDDIIAALRKAEGRLAAVVKEAGEPSLTLLDMLSSADNAFFKERDRADKAERERTDALDQVASLRTGLTKIGDSMQGALPVTHWVKERCKEILAEQPTGHYARMEALARLAEQIAPHLRSFVKQQDSEIAEMWLRKFAALNPATETKE